MNTKTITTILIYAVIGIVVVWDLFMVANKSEGDTISEVVVTAALKRPIIPFAVGVICGHLFFPMILP